MAIAFQRESPEGEVGHAGAAPAILEHLAHTTSGDVLIDAVAGSGKTSTLVALAPMLHRYTLFLAFNHHYERFPAQGVADLCGQIDDLFDNKAAKVVLSTVHRAKGSEAARVFLLQPKKMPLTWPEQQEWEYQQEQHIRYVALTRATDMLFFVGS